MKTKFSVLARVVLILALLSLSLIGVTANSSEYDHVADVDRDLDVDIFDVVRVAGAYGSSLPLLNEPNKTTITVLSFSDDPIEVDGALVAIGLGPPGQVAVNITNASGIASFELDPNKTYRALAFTDDACNYVDFTTNLQGEASIAIVLGYSFIPRIMNLPEGYVYFTYRDNRTGAFQLEFDQPSYFIEVYNVTDGSWPSLTVVDAAYVRAPIGKWPISASWLRPNNSYVFRIFRETLPTYTVIGSGVLRLFDNSKGYAIIFGDYS